MLNDIAGLPRTTRVKAKRAVCMAMCRRLHEDGLLDESLFPRKKTLDAFIEELDCSNSGLPKIGTKRSKSYYEIQSPMELRLMPNYGAQAGSRQGLLYRWTEHLADFFLKISTGGREKGPPITTRVWIFWTMIFYNLIKFTSISNIYVVKGQTLF